jgi:hypothetical protein
MSQTSYISVVTCLLFDLAFITLILLVKLMELKKTGRSWRSLLPDWMLRQKNSRPSVTAKVVNSVAVKQDNNNTVVVVPPTDKSSAAQVLVDTYKMALQGRELSMEYRMENMGLVLPDGRVVLQGVS